MNYLIQDSRKPEMLYNSILNDNPKNQVRVMVEAAGANSRISNPVFHVSLTLPEEDSLTNDQWTEIGRDYMNHMGFSSAPYSIIRHHNKPEEHIHILASRVDFDGKVVKDNFDVHRSMAFTRLCEINYRLKLVSSIKTSKSSKKSQSAKERYTTEALNKKGQILSKDKLRQELSEAIRQVNLNSYDSEKTRYEFFSTILMEKGIQVKKRTNNENMRIGFQYEFEGRVFNDTTLGQDYGLKAFSSSSIFQFHMDSGAPEFLENPNDVLRNPEIKSIIRHVLGYAMEIIYFPDEPKPKPEEQFDVLKYISESMGLGIVVRGQTDEYLDCDLALLEHTYKVEKVGKDDIPKNLLEAFKKKDPNDKKIAKPNSIKPKQVADQEKVTKVETLQRLPQAEERKIIKAEGQGATQKSLSPEEMENLTAILQKSLLDIRRIGGKDYRETLKIFRESIARVGVGTKISKTREGKFFITYTYNGISVKGTDLPGSFDYPVLKNKIIEQMKRASQLAEGQKAKTNQPVEPHKITLAKGIQKPTKFIKKNGLRP